jgi:hypothetical protein
MVLFFTTFGMGAQNSSKGGIGTLHLIAKHREGPGR